MARPREHTDDELLDATARVLARLGPHRFTLADVARAAKVTPATLVQRFGGKRGLLLAFARRAAQRARTDLADGPLGAEALVAMLVDMADRVGKRSALVASMELLLEDVRDDALRAAARAHAENVEAAIARHLRAAIEAGELRQVDPAAYARVVHAAYNGAILQWALRGRGSIGAWVAETLEAALAPLRA